MTEKYFISRAVATASYDTYEKAETAAKRAVSQNGEDYLIWKPIALATAPVPDVTVTKL